MCVELVTMDEIVDLCEYSGKAHVCRKIKQSGVNAYSFVQTGGRRVNLYSLDDVASLFPILATKKIATKAQTGILQEPENNENKKKRAPSPKRGKSEKFPPELENEICKRAFTYYMSQAKRTGIYEAVRHAVADFYDEMKKYDDRPVETVAQFYYNHRVMRRSSTFLGHAITGKWDMLWRQKFDANKSNSKLPTAQYDYISLFTDAGILSAGHGAGSIWVIDGTQLDTMVKKIDENGKEYVTTVNYLAVIDGVTGFPIQFGLLEAGETIVAVASVLNAAVRHFGAPPMGIIVDNGAAFRSKEIKNLIRSWYTPEQLSDIKNDKFRTKLFDGQTEPIIFPIAKVPRFPFKAKLEQTFNQFTPFYTSNLPVSYQGTRESRMVKFELGTVPTKALKEAPMLDLVWSDFINWIYTEYVNRPRTGVYGSFKRLTGQSPTALSAWRYYGGKCEFSDDIITLDTSDKLALNEGSRAFQIFAEAPAESKHVVTAELGWIRVTHNKMALRYNSNLLGISLYGQKITVIPDGKQCWLFKEYDLYNFDYRTPNEGDVYFIGLAESSIVDSVESLNNRYGVRNTRKTITKEINQTIANAVEADYVIENKIGSRKVELSTTPTPIILAEPEKENKITSGDEFNDDISEFLKLL